MKLITYANSVHDLSIAKESSVSEVIISSKELNRNSKLDADTVNTLLKSAKDLELCTVLEWDILITDNQFDQAILEFNKIDHSLVDKLRVQDIGVLEYALSETSMPIQFISETGNHNLTGLKKWESYIGDRLDRMVLSIELSKDVLSEYIKELTCEVEYLVLGKILLFYSPRKLLSPLLDGENEKVNYLDDRLEALGESEESPHKGFPLVENKHGTFMYHIKDLFLLDKLQDLQEIKLAWARVDLRFESDLSLLGKVSKLILENTGDVKSLKEEYPHDVIRGYFQINKSDVLFKKLKNYRIQRKDDKYIGEVIEILKGEYLAINIKKDTVFNLDSQIKFITPEGKELSCKVHELKDMALNDINSTDTHSLVLMNYMGGVWPKSQVYLA